MLLLLFCGQTGLTARAETSCEGRIEVARLLLESGADVDQETYVRRAFTCLAFAFPPVFATKYILTYVTSVTVVVVYYRVGGMYGSDNGIRKRAFGHGATVVGQRS